MLVGRFVSRPRTLLLQGARRCVHLGCRNLGRTPATPCRPGKRKIKQLDFIAKRWAKTAGYSTAFIGANAWLHWSGFLASAEPVLHSDFQTYPNQEHIREKEHTAEATTFSLIRIVESIKHFVLDLMRIGELLIIFAPTYLLAPIFVWTKGTRTVLFRCLVWNIQVSGPTFIKLGQWASTRPDLFSEELCHNLSVLQANVNPQPARTMRRRIEEALGVSIEEAFEDFDDEPIGCGCVAQVYKAKLGKERHSAVVGFQGNDRGECDATPQSNTVALKVLRVGIEDLFERDLRLMRNFVHIAEKCVPFLKWFAVAEAIERFSDHMKNQFDMREEAANLQKFRRNFDNRYTDFNVPNIVFPKPIKCTKEVLVQSFEKGVPVLSVLDKEGRSESDRDCLEQIRLADLGVKSFLKMVLIDNFVHGDLHPGNILLQIDEKGEKSLVYLDAGLVVELNGRDRKNFLNVFQAVSDRNGRRVGMLMLEQAKNHNCDDPEAFLRGMESVVNNVEHFKLSEVKIGSVLSEVLNLVRKNQIQLDSAFTNLVLSIILLEGLGRQLDPDINIFQKAVPMLMKARLNTAIDNFGS